MITAFILISFNVNALTVINEFMYNPPDEDNNKEFIEIYSEDFQNLSNFIIEDSSSEDVLKLAYYYDSNYSLIVEDGFNYSNINASIYTVGATIGNNLNNDKDIIILRDQDRKIIDLVAYSSDFGGKEKSLERISFNSLSSEKSSWIETTSEGTPGRENLIIKNYSMLKINEFLPDPVGEDDAPMPKGEFIELYNSGDEHLDINGLYFEDIVGHKLIIDDTHASSTEIKANNFLVIYANGFSGLLNNDQDEIKLYYSNLLIDKVSYSNSKEGFSWNKFNDMWRLNLPSPGEKNIENFNFNIPRIDIKNIGLVKDEKIRFGENFEVKINVYKGNSNKNSINVYVTDGDRKLSEVTNFNVFGKYVNYSLNVPVLLDDNCNNKFKDGNYDLIVSGLDLEIKEDIKIEGIINSLCNTPTRKIEDDINLEFLEVPDKIEKDKEVNVKLKIDNNSTDNIKLYVWSYLYNGPVSISGEREENLKTINLPKDSSLILDLKNDIDEHTESGDYKLKVKVKKEGRKTSNDFTTDIKVLDINNEGITNLTNENKVSGKVIYESSDIKTKNLSLIILDIILILLIALLLFRKSL